LICISIGNQIFQLPAGHTHICIFTHTSAQLLSLTLSLSLSVFLMTDRQADGGTENQSVI